MPAARLPMVAAVVVAALAVSMSGLDAQSRAGTAVISGVVVSADASRTPIRRARVALASTDGRHHGSATTDDAGRFVIREVRAGRYTLQASKAAWVTASYGASRPERSGTPIEIAEGQTVSNLEIAMPKGASISGTVRDASGRPVPGVVIEVFRHGYLPATGERTLREQNNPALAYASYQPVTDDRGAYRVFGLPPGEYFIKAQFSLTNPWIPTREFQELSSTDVQRALAELRSDQVAPAASTATAARVTPRVVGFVPTWHPGVVDASRAAGVTVAAAEDRGGVDLTLQVVPLARVAARVLSPSGLTTQMPAVFLIPGDSTSTVSMGGGRPSPGGEFAFPMIPPGRYVLVARANVAESGGPPRRTSTVAGAEAMLHASQDLFVSGSDIDVTLALSPGPAVSGRVEFADAGAQSGVAVGAVEITLRPLRRGPSLSVAPARVGDAGQFRWIGLAPERYTLGHSAPESFGDWHLRSAITNGRDVLDTTLDLTAGVDVTDLVLKFTDRPSELTGTLQTPAGTPATECFIIVFAADRGFWTPTSRRVVQVRPGTDGRFLIRNLPAGEYRLAALTDVEPGEWRTPTFLETLLPASVPVTIRDASTTRQDLRIAR